MNKSSCVHLEPQQKGAGHFSKGSTRLTKMPSFSNSSQHTQSHSNTYVLKLQSTAQDHIKQIRANRPIVEQLECQRRFFKRICEKQKQKLQAIDLALIREQYENELETLREKRNHMHDMITTIHEQAEEKRQTWKTMAKTLSENQLFLEKSLSNLLQQNKRYQQMIMSKRNILAFQKQQIGSRQQQIKHKQKIQQKYKNIVSEINQKDRSEY